MVLGNLRDARDLGTFTARFWRRVRFCSLNTSCIRSRYPPVEGESGSVHGDFCGYHCVSWVSSPFASP